MANYIFNISVSGGDITTTEKCLYAQSVEYITSKFSFDGSWDDLFKTAIFRKNDAVYSKALENDECTVPYEVLDEGILYVSVIGVADNIRATTGEVAIEIKSSGYVQLTPAEPSEDPFNYFINSALESKNAAETAATKSISAAKSSQEYCESVTQNAEEVEAALIRVLGAESNTKAYCEEAAASRSAAKNSETLAEEYKDLTYSYCEDTETAAKEIQNITANEIETHNSGDNPLAHPNILNLANEAKQIALGRATSLCFETESQLIAWVEGQFTRSDGITASDLKIGDNLYVIELGVPDYWWDGEQIQPLGAEKPDLSDYYTKTQIDDRISTLVFKEVSESDYADMYAQGTLEAGCIYFVYGEE